MPSRILPLAAVALAVTFAAAKAPAQQVTPTTGIDYEVLGSIKPRHARDIAASSWWSIGAETLDRDFASYEKYRAHLGPLGAKSVRLQAGWAKCEKQPGAYAWEWLDAIVNDAIAQGVRPWLELSYGNPIYAGGGDTGLGGGFPSSTEALAAWDRWCRALVERYQDRVHEWEIWNEPDINNRGTAPVEAYIDLYLRTAAIIREVQPKSQLWALALAHNADYADAFLAGMRTRGKLGLIDALTYHGYPRNPDDTTLGDRLRAIVAKHGAKFAIRQGETGAPSRYQENFALSRITWTETTHAKWDLRRLLAHRAKDIPMNLFTLSDLHYTQATNQTSVDGVVRMNYKGLVATHPDQSVAYLKPAYAAAQSVFTLFDDSVTRIADFPVTSTFLRTLAVTGYRHTTHDNALMVTLHFNDAPPAEANGVTRADLALAAARFKDPVLVDLRTSTVYAIPRDAWAVEANGTRFRNLPAYDSPLLIAERSAIPLQR